MKKFLLIIGVLAVGYFWFTKVYWAGRLITDSGPTEDQVLTTAKLREVSQACTAETAKFCAVRNFSTYDWLDCLERHEDDLGTVCRKKLATVNEFRRQRESANP